MLPVTGMIDVDNNAAVLLFVRYYSILSYSVVNHAFLTLLCSEPGAVCYSCLYSIIYCNALINRLCSVKK